jgi:hypothetical protein
MEVERDFSSEKGEQWRNDPGLNFERMTELSANTLDNRRNCRHNHMLDEGHLTVVV